MPRAGLDASLPLLKEALAGLPVGVALVEAPSGRALFRNDEASRIFGRDPERPIVEGVADYGRFPGFKADGSPYAPAEWPVARSILTGETGAGEEAEIERADGTRGFIRMSSAPVRAGDGRVVAGLVTFVDITDAKRAERERERLHSETAVHFRLSDVANRATSPEPVFEAALDAIRDVLGFERSSVLVFDAAGVMRFRAWRGLSDEYRRAVEGHSPWTPATPDPRPIVVRDVREDAELAGYAPVFAEEGIRALAFIPLVSGERVVGKFMLYSPEPRDLDARTLEKAGVIAAQVASAVGRAQVEDALREANRRKDEFLAMLSHELRNPLAAVRNAVHLLQSLPADDAGRRRWLDVVDRQTGNLVRLVDDLLDVSRITRGRIELQRAPLDLRETIQRALAATAAPLAGHRVTADLGRAELPVDGDSVRLEQVFVNLIANAAKYTPPGGEISLTAERRDGEVLVRVRDTGIGIEKDRLARVFELFDQGGRDLARTQGGLGVGLTVVRGLVELHGGRVEVSSEGPGRGSAFTVVLREAPRPAPAVPASRLPVEAGRRILVVDDHVDGGDMVATLLRSWGHIVDVETDATAVVARAHEFRPEVILLDIGLPVLNGYDLARLLRADPVTAGAVLVALTGYGQPADRDRALASGFARHLVKPVQPDALREALARLAGPEAPSLGPAVASPSPASASDRPGRDVR